MYIHTNQSRRTFLRRSSQLGLLGSAAPLAGSLSLMGAASAATSYDYRALVCIFLYGGNDYANTLPPYDSESYRSYKNIRRSLGIEHEHLAATVLRPNNDLRGRQFALNPALAQLKPLFDQGSLAVLLNVGTLVQPTSKAQVLAKSVPLPPSLLSHNDQQSYFQSGAPEGAKTGWGGLMGDLIQSSNGSPALTCINASGGAAAFLSGEHLSPYSLGRNGAGVIAKGRPLMSAEIRTALEAIVTNGHSGVLASEHARVSSRAIQLGEKVSSALALAPEMPASLADNRLAAQLSSVARLISVAKHLGQRRQVFFVSMGGWDTHDGLMERHPALLAGLGDAMRAFFDTTVQLGIANQVTTFTASDFGRSLVPNDDGSDHGWGGMHFIMGGSVKGKGIFGTPPAIGADTNDDVGAGRLIPTTSVDQYAATLGAWLGVPDSGLLELLPNLANFNPSSRNLGFV